MITSDEKYYLNKAKKYALGFNHEIVSEEHFLLALLEDVKSRKIFNLVGINSKEVALVLEETLCFFSGENEVAPESLEISPDLKEILELGRVFYELKKSDELSFVLAYLYAIVIHGSKICKQVLFSFGITKELFERILSALK